VDIHAPFLHRCLALAEQGRGKTGINPLVGAVLVRRGKIIAEAFHEGYGRLHAERALLTQCTAPLEPEDVLYVNLEPCSHRGKTPPCTDILIERGVKYVVYGLKDPNPQVAGKGIAALERAGITVTGPVERARSAWLNRGFTTLQEKGRPWITLKRAQTKTGLTAAPDGSRLTITSKEQDTWSHAHLRAKHDAILVGVGTILADDPQLSTRFIQNTNTEVDQHSPLRIVLDPKLRIKEDARVLSKELAQGTVVISGSGLGSGLAKKGRIEALGTRVWECPLDGELFAWKALWELLTTPKGDFFGITSILVEGGAKTWEAFEDAGMVDEEMVLVG